MLKERYERLTSSRESFLHQARLHSELTIPSLIPPDGFTDSYQDLYKPFQSTGATGVNSLSNKLTGALYPVNEPWFKFEVVSTAEEFENTPPDVLAGIDSQLSAMEQKILRIFTTRGDRSAITEGMKHLLVSGNVTLYVGEKTSRIYSLTDYVAQRDGEGSLIRLIVLDNLSYETFKENHKEKLDVQQAHEGNRKHPLRNIEVYTEMYRDKGRWVITREAAGVQLGSQETYPIDKPPYLVLRFNRIDGQHYGRGYVESLYGDLRSLEELSKALVEGSAISARCVTLVNPNGLTSIRLFEEAPNGGVIPGSPNDVATVKVDKGGDLAISANSIDRIEARLDKSFMVTEARDAERVTAEEIRNQSNEVEKVLGGVYATLSEEFQRPFVSRLISVLKRSGDIPDWPEGVLDTAIVTGSAGIGRGQERERLGQFLGALQQAVGPDTLEKYTNPQVVIARLAAAFGIDLQGLIKSPEEIAAEAEQQQQQAMTAQLGGPAIGAMGKVAAESIKQGVPNGDQANPEDPGAGTPGGPPG